MYSICVCVCVCVCTVRTVCLCVLRICTVCVCVYCIYSMCACTVLCTVCVCVPYVQYVRVYCMYSIIMYVCTVCSMYVCVFTVCTVCVCVLYVQYIPNTPLHSTCLYFHTSRKICDCVITFSQYLEMLCFTSCFAWFCLGPVLSCPMVIAFGIKWQQTAAGETAMPDCTNGTAKRRCGDDGQWENPDLSDCVSQVRASSY